MSEAKRRSRPTPRERASARNCQEEKIFGFRKRPDRTREAAAKTGAAFSRLIGGLFSRDTLDDDFWDSLEEALIMADVGMKTTMELVARVREKADSRKACAAPVVRGLLRSEITDTLQRAQKGGAGLADDQAAVVLFFGVNGVGKTTSIAKLAHSARGEGRSVLLAAADTFRAGAIEQLQEWGRRLGVDVIAHRAGGDPGAVAFDAMAAARARGTDLILVDTAGRLHTKHNLMEELKKVDRIIAAQAGDFARYGLLVIDSATGQNGLIQARAFSEAIGCDGVFLTKLDGTAKGGIVLAIAGEMRLPVWFIGTGESLGDLSTFDPVGFADALIPEPTEA